MKKRACLSTIALFAVFLSACAAPAAPEITQVPATATKTAAPATRTATATASPTASATASASPTATTVPATETPTAQPEAETAETPTAQSSVGGRITISRFRFGPDNLQVKVGTRVTWTNQDGTSHTVTSDTGVFDSGALDQDDSFSFTFNDVGSFPYHCEFHSGMAGKIEVVP